MIRIGPAGWAYKDWEGIVYPNRKPRGFDPVAYLAQYFDTIEINSSFYGPPRPEAAHTWVRRVSANTAFRFTAKLGQMFTHKRNATAADERAFKLGLEPLAEAGRLGALLLQFPWSFRFEVENRRYLSDLARRFGEYPLVLEVRHASWSEPDALELLSELGLGLANIDQPLFKKSVKPGAEVTGATGYIRLHGRNYRNWFSPTADVKARYDYLYSTAELEPWVDRIRFIGEQAEDTYAITNNHHLGKAVANALEITSLLRGEPVEGPPQLLERYTELRPFVVRQPDLLADVPTDSTSSEHRPRVEGGLPLLDQADAE